MLSLFLLRSLQKLLEFFFENLIGPFLGFNIVLMSLFALLLLFLVPLFHLINRIFQLIHLIFKFFSLGSQRADLGLHVFLLLFGLKSSSHTESDWWFVQSLVGLDGLNVKNVLRIWFNLWLWQGEAHVRRSWLLFVWSVHQSIESTIILGWGRYRFTWPVFAVISYRVFIVNQGHPVWLRGWLIRIESLIKCKIPELLFFGSVLSGREDGVEDVFSVRTGIVGFVILGKGEITLICFLPELETRTGLEYLTRLWGWLKFVGWVDVI